MRDTPSNDRRVRRTRSLLIRALGSLLHEKPFDSIVLKEILHRADVGRSTFYAHFRDKDELLSSTMRELLASSPDPATSRLPRAERLLRFSLPILEHVDRQRRADGSPGGMGRRGRSLLHRQLDRELTRFLTDEIQSDAIGHGPAASGLPPGLLVRHVTSTFIAVLEWWTESPSRMAPVEVDVLFRSLVRPALSRSLDG